MPEADQYRMQAAKCRELAERADERTASNLRMLADALEEEAAKLEAQPVQPKPE